MIIEMSLEGAPAKRYKELVYMMLNSAKANMIANGFSLAEGDIQADWNIMKKRRNGPVAIKFADLLTAKGFYFQYKDYEWQSDNGCQTMIIRLSHETFDADYLLPGIRSIISEADNMTPQTLAAINRSIAI